MNGLTLSDEYIKIKENHETIIRNKNPNAFAAENALMSKENLERWLSSADDALEKQLRIDKAGAEAHLMASEQGNFKGFQWIAEVLDHNSMTSVMTSYLSGVTSNLGLKYDVMEKMKIADIIDGKVPEGKESPISGMLRLQIYEDAGSKIASSGDVSVVDSMSDSGAERTMISSAKLNAVVTLDLVDKIGDDHKRIQAQSAVVKTILARDANVVAEYVSNQVDGTKRNLIIKAMVEWLIKMNDFESANQWVPEITNSEIKSSLEKIMENSSR